MGQEGLASLSSWPEFDPSKTKEDRCTIGVQVNGKKRGSIEITKETSQEEAQTQALQVDAIANAIGDCPIRKVIYVPGKILNIIAK